MPTDPTFSTTEALTEMFLIRVIPATDAGGYFFQTDSIPGFARATKKEYNHDELMNSPQSVHMIVHLYQNTLEENKILYQKIEEKNVLLENERLKSSTRFVASILLIISQVVIGIGCSIINVIKIREYSSL